MVVMPRRELTIGYCALRIGYALGLLAAPKRVARPWLGQAMDNSGAGVAVRGLGARDLALAAGGAFSAANGAPARPWLVACAASDAVDLTATLLADGAELPPRAKPGTVAAAGVFGATAAFLAWRSS